MADVSEREYELVVMEREAASAEASELRLRLDSQQDLIDQLLADVDRLTREKAELKRLGTLASEIAIEATRRLR